MPGRRLHATVPFERIRRDRRDEDLSVRALADRHRVHRRTVRQALGDAVPPRRKIPRREAPVLGPYVATVLAWLVADLDAPRKQRHTARRIWQRLIEEEGAVVGESTVRSLVARLRAEIAAGRGQVMVPQTHRPGINAALDLGNLDADLVAVQARRWQLAATSPPPPVPLPATAGQVAAVGRPAPSLAGYDQLLTGAGA